MVLYFMRAPVFGQVWLSPCRLCQALLSAPSSSGWFLACRPSAFFSSLTLSGFARSGLGVLVLVFSPFFRSSFVFPVSCPG